MAMLRADEALAPSVEQVANAAGLAPEALALLRPELDVRAFVHVLLQEGRFGDAVRLIAHALPKREAIWWALLCARDAAGEAPAAEIRAVFDAVDRWIRYPDDAQRRATKAAADEATLKTAAGAVGMAVFVSGGSISVAGQPDVPPSAFLTAKAVAMAVILAALSGDPKRANERFRLYATQGVHLGGV